jgi:signal transduction histidine kinase
LNSRAGDFLVRCPSLSLGTGEILHEFISLNREEIIRRCRTKVAVRTFPAPTAQEISHGIPVFLDQLTDVLRGGGAASGDIARSALHHGHELLLKGFTVSQVVHDYGDVCQAITELAVETSAPIRTDEFRMLNESLDNAIAGAVTEFGRAQNQSTLDDEAARGNERAGFLAHEMRNLLNTAIIAFEVIRTGKVAVGGSMGTVVQRNLRRAGDLISRSLAEVRLSQGIQCPERFLVAEFIDELTPAAVLEASVAGVGLSVLPIEAGVEVEADRPVLAAVVMNLLQNAFKFTRTATVVTLQVSASAERVLIEIHDECGGLPGGNADGLFRPGEQRGADRTGLGLGLAYSRWAVESNHGRVYARNVPDKGCVFTIDIPRIQRATHAGVVADVFHAVRE